MGAVSLSYDDMVLPREHAVEIGVFKYSQSSDITMRPRQWLFPNGHLTATTATATKSTPADAHLTC
jgi:hypothetical protein